MCFSALFAFIRRSVYLLAADLIAGAAFSYAQFLQTPWYTCTYVTGRDESAATRVK